MIRRVRRAALIAMAVALAIAGQAAAAAPTPASSAGADPAAAPTPALTRERAIEIARTSPRLQRWLDDHPIARTAASSDPKTATWTISFIDAAETTQAVVLVSDATAGVTETRTGPQVAWQMARGYKGAFGRSITTWRIWIPLLLLSILPFLTWRGLIRWRTLDLIALGAFTVSLTWFNRGEIFTSVPLAYPPLVYLAARLTWIGVRGRRAAPPLATHHAPAPAGAPAARPRLVSWCPTWLLLCLMLVAVGLRIGLNAFDSNVVDVGYAGVIGADRIVDGQTPYGTAPSDCGQCDTYGPATYLVYIPFELAFPWIGTWNDLPAAHGAAVLFDLVALLGMVVLGWRLGGRRLAAGLGLAWAASPFTAYVLESNSNDTLIAACLVWGLVFVHRPMARGVALGLAALAKFTPAILILLWGRHPFPRSAAVRGRVRAYIGGLALATAATAWVVFLDGDDGLRAFWSRTVGFQLDRESPFSIWGQHTWLRPVQIGLAALVAIAAIACAVRPRSLGIREFAALSGALLLGIQLTMTHWFYLYIPWFLPFALLVLIPEWPARAVRAAPPPPAGDEDVPEAQPLAEAPA